MSFVPETACVRIKFLGGLRHVCVFNTGTLCQWSVGTLCAWLADLFMLGLVNTCMQRNSFEADGALYPVLGFCYAVCAAR